MTSPAAGSDPDAPTRGDEIAGALRAPMLPVQHVALAVRDADDARRFYTEVLGFDVLERPDVGIAGAWLATGNGIQIHLFEVPDFVPPKGPHLAFEVDDLDAELARLRAAGVEVGDPFELDGVRQAFFVDPSGNRLELNQPGTGG